MKQTSRLLSGMMVAALAGPAYAGSLFDGGKLLATGGVSQVEGAGGGGLTPWALITGYGTRDGIGANVHYTYLNTGDYSLDTYGVAVGLFDRLELSIAQQKLKGIDAALDGVEIRQDVFGAKVKLFGNAVYDQDRWMPQVAVGLQHKRNKGIDGLQGLGVNEATDLGAKRNKGTDYYVSATKLFLAQSLLVNGTLRLTKANQFGLLGFGSAADDDYELMPEVSVAYLLNRKFAVGTEYRAKPRNLGGLDQEEAAYDVFAAWFPTRNVSFTLAYVDLGTIVKAFNPDDQRGAYLSVQLGF